MKLKELLYSKYYLRSFFSIIALMVVFLGLVAFFFWNTNLSRQQAAIDQEVQQSLAKAREQLSGKLEEMLHITLEISADNSFTFSPVMGRTQAEKTIIQKTLDRYVSCNTFISDIAYESLLDTENIFSSRGRYSKEMYAKYIYTTKDFDLEAFALQQAKQTVNTVPAWNLVSIINPVPRLAFVYSLPVMSTQPVAFVTFYIEKSSMDAIFKNALSGQFENVYLMENDRLVYAYHGNDTQDISLPEEAIETVYHSKDGFAYADETLPMNNWRFVARWNQGTLYREYNGNRLFFAVLLVSALLVVILSSAMVALSNYAPLGHVLAKYRDLYQKGAPVLRKDDLRVLESFVDDEIEKRQRLARQLFLSNLIWNQYEDIEAIGGAAAEAGVSFPYLAFICCALMYKTQDESARADGWLAQIEEALDGADSLCYGTLIHGQPMLYLVINLNEKRVGVTVLEAALAGCLAYPGIQAQSLGVSSTQMTPEKIAGQYQEASHAAREGLLLGQPVTYFSHLLLVGEHPQFILAKRRISDALKRGDAGKAMAAWDALRKAVADDPVLAPRERYISYRLLDHIVSHFCGDLPEDTQPTLDLYQQVLAEPSAATDYAEAVASLISLLAGAPKVPGEAKSDMLLARIMRCMDTHYRDNDLSLERIAGECNITSSYLVRYFKSKTGSTPMQYVDQKRMEHARQLLAETSFSLHEVTRLSGYLDESNFARKFKKLYECTPMHFRKQNL